MKTDLESELKYLDERKFGKFQVLTILTTGLGVFADGYDLAAIGIVLRPVLNSFGLNSVTSFYASLLTGGALFGAIIGALTFGWLANHGRKKYYGVEALLLTIATFLQAFSFSIAILIALRIFVGFAIGADYVMSPVILGELSNTKDRGKSMAIGFGLLWGLGATASAILYILTLHFTHDTEITWRIVLGCGAIPTIFVIYLRRKIPETKRYQCRIKENGDFIDTTPINSYLKRYLKKIIIASMLWFLFDIIVYASILFGPSLLAKRVGLDAETFQLINFLIFIVPGSLFGAFLNDIIGRRKVQYFGFIGMFITLSLYALYSQDSTILYSGFGSFVGIILFGLYNSFMQGGPGSVTASGLLGVELFPTKIRAIAQGITVASSRLGAFITSFAFPFIYNNYGESNSFFILAAVAAISAMITYLYIPETKKLSLEEASQEL